MGGVVAKYAFMPPPPTYDKTLPGLLMIPRPDRKQSGVPAVFLEHKNTGKSRWTVLFTHGNAEDLGELQELMKVYHRGLDVNFLAYDYTGYGLNGTHMQCSEDDCYKDIWACYNYLVKERAIPPSSIIPFGRSLGTGPTTQLAKELCDKSKKSGERLLGGVVLQSPLMSCVHVASDNLAKIPFLDIFCNIDKIHHVTVPIFLAHGTQDEVIAFRHSQELQQKNPKHVWRLFAVEGAGHNNIEARHLSEYLDHLRGFLDHVGEHVKNTPPPK